MKKLIRRLKYLYYIWTNQTFDILISQRGFREGDIVLYAGGQKAEILKESIYLEGVLYTVRGLKEEVIDYINEEQRKLIYKQGIWK